MSKKSLRIAFVHLDLGVGGAERLVVCAANALQRTGHSVVIYTSHHDPQHAFSLTTDGTLDVRVYGDWIPRTLRGKFHVFFSIIRTLYVALRLLLSGEKYDVIFNDQVSAPNPILQFCASYLVFYCHFPDMLLCVHREGFWKKIYRSIFDKIEIYTTGCCDALLVNSNFTAQVFRDTFHNLKAFPLMVVYPTIDLEEIEEKKNKLGGLSISQNEELKLMDPDAPFFLSINRYERKKNIRLAIDSFLHLKDNLWREKEFKLQLVIAGGYDNRVAENVKYYEELRKVINEYKLSAHVVLLRNISDETRWLLLMKCVALIYTPKFEHFGIVPCEAMAVGNLVIASNSGGPKESVVHEKTGYLCEDSAEEFGNAMMKIWQMRQSDLPSLNTMQTAATRRVAEHFSSDGFSKRLNSIFTNFFESEGEGEGGSQTSGKKQK